MLETRLHNECVANTDQMVILADTTRRNMFARCARERPRGHGLAIR